MFKTQSGKFNYTSSGFNEFGDEISHYDYPHTDYEIIKFDDSPSESNVRLVHDIIERFRKKGIKVYILPPAIAKSVYEKNEDYAKTVEKLLIQNGMRFEVPLTRHVFPDSMTFDTYYHMGKNAVDSLSKLIIEEYKGFGYR